MPLSLCRIMVTEFVIADDIQPIEFSSAAAGFCVQKLQTFVAIRKSSSRDTLRKAVCPFLRE